MTWAEFRAALVNQFSDSGDEYVAQAKLAKLRQAPGESVQNFCKRIFAIAEAYKGQDLANTEIQQLLVDTLISGVTSDILCKHLN